MSKLGDEIIVKIKSSETSIQRFITDVTNPYVIPLFELLKLPLSTSIAAEEMRPFKIKTVDGCDFIATAFKFDLHPYRRDYVVLGGDMKTVKKIPPYMYKALDIHMRMRTDMTYAVGYLPYDNTAKCFYRGHEEMIEIESTKEFWKFCRALDSIRAGYVGDYLGIGDYAKEVYF